MAPDQAIPLSKPFGWRQAALVFAVALIPRLAHFWFVRATPLAGEYVPDLSAYLYAASRIMNSAYFFIEPTLMNPGYALILAPQYILFGPVIPVFVLTNAVLDAGSAVLCAGLAARMAVGVGAPGRERAAGLWAGFLYAVCGPLLFYALLPLGEGPAIFCLLAALTLLFGTPGPGGLRAWLAGGLFALAALLRPNLAPAVALLLLAWCLAPGTAARTPRLRAAARCLAGLLLTLLPFMAHNMAVGGRATPFGFMGGFTLYTGNHPGASGVGESLPGFSDTPYLVVAQAWSEAARQSGRDLTLAQADAWWYGRTWSFVAGHPGEAARILGRKALLLLNPDGVDATVNQEFSARFSPVPGLLALPLGLVFALAAAGLYLAGRDRAGRRSPEAVALAVALLAVAGVLVLFQVTPRYRSLLLPLALCFAGMLLAEAPALWRGPRSRLAGPALCFALVLGLSGIPLETLVYKPGMEALEHARLARYYLLKGPQFLAQAEYEKALAQGAPDAERLKAELQASRLLSAQDAAPPSP